MTPLLSAQQAKPLIAEASAPRIVANPVQQRTFATLIAHVPSGISISWIRRSSMSA